MTYLGTADDADGGIRLCWLIDRSVFVSWGWLHVWGGDEGGGGGDDEGGGWWWWWWSALVCWKVSCSSKRFPGPPYIITVSLPQSVIIILHSRKNQSKETFLPFPVTGLDTNKIVFKDNVVRILDCIFSHSFNALQWHDFKFNFP